MVFYRHTFTMMGKRPFPIDMLRYDRCTPKHEADSNAIERSHSRQGTDEVFTVTLVSDKPAKVWSPTTGRWRSMGYECTLTDSDNTEKYI